MRHDGDILEELLKTKLNINYFLQTFQEKGKFRLDQEIG